MQWNHALSYTIHGSQLQTASTTMEIHENCIPGSTESMRH